MLRAIIEFSLKNKLLVILAGAAWSLAGGVYALKSYPAGRHPRPVGYAGHHLHRVAGSGAADRPGSGHLPADDQDAVGAGRFKVVRGYSFYGLSFVYVIFAEGTDPYRARSRVLEYLNGLSSGACRPTPLPLGSGPDATGVGWAFMYALNSQAAGSGRATLDAGLVPALPAGERRRGGRGGPGRRLREAVPDCTSIRCGCGPTICR
jgi:Cu(I)/Ag(I) efflux system membrane protein CusA/SilA